MISPLQPEKSVANYCMMSYFFKELPLIYSTVLHKQYLPHTAELNKRIDKFKWYSQGTF